jgi:hypothetical protein
MDEDEDDDEDEGDDDEDADDDEVEGGQTHQPHQAPPSEEEEDELSREVAAEVGRSLGILSSVLQEIEAKEAHEVRRDRAKAQRDDQRAKSTAAPIGAPRYDPTKPESRVFEVGTQPQPKPPATATGIATKPSPSVAVEGVGAGAPLPAVRRADLTSLTEIFGVEKKEEVESTAAMAGEVVTFSFGFDMGAPPPLPHDGGGSGAGTAAAGGGGAEEGMGSDGEGHEEARLGDPRVVPLWGDLGAVEATARRFVTDKDDLMDPEEWKREKERLTQDYKKKRRNAHKGAPKGKGGGKGGGEGGNRRSSAGGGKRPQQKVQRRKR